MWVEKIYNSKLNKYLYNGVNETEEWSRLAAVEKWEN